MCRTLRHVRRTLAGAAGVVAAALFVVGAPAGTTSSPPGCAPAGPDRCTKLLETLTVPGGGAAVTATTVFHPGLSYKFLFSGSVQQNDSGAQYDAFYCFVGTDCSPPHSCGVCLLDVNGAGLGQTFGISALTYGFAFSNGPPPYSSNHIYAIPFSKDSAVKSLDGKLTFHVGIPSTGAYTVRIYGSGEPPTEKVDFAVTQSDHVVQPGGHGVFSTRTTRGLGQLVVPKGRAASTGARGTIRFTALKFSPKSVLILDEETITLRVLDGFYDSGRKVYFPNHRG
jgi:hypothetical protein